MRLLSATALLCLFAFAPIHTATAQDGSPLAAQAVPADSEMLLEADTLIYDNDNNTVTASGSVQIDYNGNRLVADRIVYDRKTGKLLASGNVQFVDPQGTVVYSDEIDITDNFADGFLNALRVETTDKTYFAAESAERQGGTTTTFNNGVYTACEPCEENPGKAPIWRIKGRKIIWNGKEKTIRFERSRFELFGLPIAYMPFIEVPDPTVKRKSGLLLPGIHYKSELGFGVSVPYYLALAPTYDLLVEGHYYAKQGFVPQAEWRQQFNNGAYYIRVAGVRQANPAAFGWGTVDAGTLANPNRLRGMIGTKGDFRINPRWTFGWDILAQSDKNFSYTYSVQGFSDYVKRSQIYLNGMTDRNSFDARALKFDVQEDLQDGSVNARDNLQPVVLPVIDYAYTAPRAVAGGELRFDVNAQALRRDVLDQAQSVPAVRGISGTTGRVTAEAEWKRTLVTDAGLIVTPLLHVRGDSIYVSADAASVAGINQMAASRGIVADIRSAYNRFMATAGLEVRWPVLFSSTSATHVLEPVAQVFARPDERFAQTLGIPNEDAQSFVFDATTLFERDKFSGYDRMEGGSRLNLGMRYTGTLASGWSANAVFGQSYQLGGVNAFATPDLVNVGAFSGLETPRSDFVGLVGFASPHGFYGSVSARVDEQTLELRRAEAKAGVALDRGSVTAKYAYIQAQPLYGLPDDRHEVTLSGSLRLREYWRVYASGTYDFQTKVLISDSIGFAYDDECFTYSMTFSESRSRTTREVSQAVGFQLSFRTIGDFGTSSSGFSSN